MTWDLSLSWFLNEWRKAEESGTPPYMVITAQKLQMGKTSLALFLAENVERTLHGREYDVKYLALSALEFVRVKAEAPEWCPLIGDEWNRAAGNRSWHTPENRIVAEDLATTAYEHHPSFFTMPHQHLTDNAIVDICTSQAIVTRKGYAKFYWREKDQLNRAIKVFTHKLGEGDFPKPSLKLWNDYKEKRLAFTVERREKYLEQLAMMQQQADKVPSLETRESLLAKVLADTDSYTDKKGKVSATLICAREKVSWNKGQMAAAEANTMIGNRSKQGS